MALERVGAFCRLFRAAIDREASFVRACTACSASLPRRPIKKQTFSLRSLECGSIKISSLARSLARSPLKREK